MSAVDLAGVPVVYRVYDPESLNLLYIGASTNLSARMLQHEIHSWWWRDGQAITAQPCDSIEDAYTAEKAAILAEKPLYNVRGRGPQAAWRAVDFVEYLIAFRHQESGRWQGAARRFRRFYPEIAELALPAITEQVAA